MKMKKIVMLSIFSVIYISNLIAQAPLGIPYQAVARNADGSVMANASLTVLFSIRSQSANGPIVYSESHNLTSNSNGLINCFLGEGVASVGVFSELDWSSNKFLQVILNGNDLGTTQLMSVPYSLYSTRSKSADGVLLSVSLTGDTLYSGNGNFIIVPGISNANYISGCTDQAACNYNAAAINENGTCLYTGASCDDGISSTINDQITLDCFCAGTNSNIGLPGSDVFPSNGTCSAENISVTGCNGETTLESDGIIYDLVEIGGQCWFADNLSADQYRNGDLITSDLNNAAWTASVQGAMAHYNNNVANDAVYGKLYNWYAVTDSRGVCPAGWHVPNDCEWMFLENSLGMLVNEQEIYGWRGEIGEIGGKLKSTSIWNSPNTAGTNSSGFTAVPGGYRNQTGSYFEIGNTGSYWSSSALDASNAWFRKLFFNYSNSNRYYISKKAGFSVRCLKD